MSLFGLLEPILKPEREKNMDKAQTYEAYWFASSRLAPCDKEIEFGIRNPGTVLLVERWILGFGIRNTAQGIWNPANNWNPESKFH